MNKYTLLMILFVFLVIITLIAQDVELATTENILSGAVSDGSQTSGGIINMMGVWFRVITFQIPAIPFVITAIVFYPISMGFIAMIVDVLKDLIPFT